MLAPEMLAAGLVSTGKTIAFVLRFFEVFTNGFCFSADVGAMAKELLLTSVSLS